MTLLIARGSLDDVPETDALIRATADWLIKKGEPLWGPNETSLDELTSVTLAGELIVGRVKGELATCMYLHDEDRLFWSHASPGEARFRGRPLLRLDCEPRAQLLALYASANYSRVDATPIQVGEHFVVRHERRV